MCISSIIYLLIFIYTKIYAFWSLKIKYACNSSVPIVVVPATRWDKAPLPRFPHSSLHVLSSVRADTTPDTTPPCTTWHTSKLQRCTLYRFCRTLISISTSWTATIQCATTPPCLEFLFATSLFLGRQEAAYIVA